MKPNKNQISKLRLINGLLKEQNLAIKNNIDLRGKRMENSLSSISGPNFGALAQTPITSFNPMLQNNIYAPLTIDWPTLLYAYKTHGIIQTLCDTPVLDALRGGITIRSKQMSEDEIGELEDAMEEKGILDVIAEARIWTRLFGGGGLVFSTDEPSDYPLDLKKLARDRELEIYAFNRWEMVAPWRTAAQYNFYGKTVDSSRVLTMSGKTAPYILRWQLQGWGMSELERVIEDFNTYIRVKNVIYELLYEAKVDVYKFKDFAAQMLSAEAEQQTNKRMQIMNSQKTYNSALLLDKEDEFDQRQVTFSGLAEIYREARIEMASALRMPMTKLFGLSASGFNSGEDDIENYNGMVESEIRRPLRPVIKKVLNLLCISIFGDTYDDLDFEFNPLRVLGADQEEQIKRSKFDRIIGLYDRNLITPKELGEMLAKEKLVDSAISIISHPEVETDISATGEEVNEEIADLPERSTLGVGRKPGEGGMRQGPSKRGAGKGTGLGDQSKLGYA